MQIIEEKTDAELLQSLTAELAKSQNELKCATADVAKVQSRLSFLRILANELSNRIGAEQ